MESRLEKLARVKAKKAEEGKKVESRGGSKDTKNKNETKKTLKKKKEEDDDTKKQPKSPKDKDKKKGSEGKKSSRKQEEEQKQEEQPKKPDPTVDTSAVIEQNLDKNILNESTPNGKLSVQQTCTIHNKPLYFFCETTETLICQECTIMGPYNSQIYKITNMDEAFKFRFDSVNKLIFDNLKSKRDQLTGQIVRLDHRIDEVKNVKKVIERDIRNEYSGFTERLKSAEGVMTAVLMHDLNEVQQDITRIDEILTFMQEITESGTDGMPDRFAFLHYYPQLNENIEFSISKQIKTDIEVSPDNLPRELHERQKLMECYEKQQFLLKQKNEVIYLQSEELKKTYEQYHDQFDKETKHEMEQWVKLVDKYADKLKEFDLVCAFCGQHIAHNNINSECTENNAMFNSLTFFTEEEPPENSFCKRRHWFGAPSTKQISEAPLAAGFAGNRDQRCDQFLIENQTYLPIIRKLVQNLTQQQLTSLSKNVRSKDEFVNGLFEYIDSKSVKPAEIVAYTSLFKDKDARDGVHVLMRYKAAQTARSPQKSSLNSSRISAYKDVREVQDRVKEAVENTELGYYGLEKALLTCSGRKKSVTEDQMLLAFNKVNAMDLELNDVREFFQTIKGQTKQSEEIEISEILEWLKS